MLIPIVENCGWSSFICGLSSWTVMSLFTVTVNSGCHKIQPRFSCKPEDFKKSAHQGRVARYFPHLIAKIVIKIATMVVFLKSYGRNRQMF